MKRIVSLISVFICVWTHSPAQQEYTGYFRNILTIEEAVASEDFHKALVLYRQLFEQYDRVFARDAFNACQLAAFSDTSSFQYYYYRCAQSGVSWKTLSNNRYISLLLPVSPDSLYMAGRQLYISSIDTALRREFLLRYKTEQDSKSDSKEFAAVVQGNFNRILELARKRHFPDERIIGTNDELENGMLNATLKHYPWSFLLLTPYIQQSLKTGGMQPIGVYYIYGFNQTQTGVLYRKKPATDTAFFKKCYNLAFGKFSTDTAAVNKNRRAVMISSIAVQSKLKQLNERYALDLKEGY